MKKKMRSKRGQFYIIAAIIIVVIISSIATTVTYTITKSAPKGIKELSSEVKQEIPIIERFAIYNKNDTDKLIYNFTQGDLAEYFFSKTEESSMAMVYRNSSGNLNVIYYNKKDSGTIVVQDFNLHNYENYVKKVNVKNVTINNEDYTNVSLLNQSFLFKLNPDQDFYFVIMQNKSGEEYVERN